jgi:predicted transcriptional regulator
MKPISFNVETTPEKYFHQLVEILKIFPPFNELRKRQREAFAEILYQFYIFRDESEKVRERLVFDHKTKEEIAKRLDISKGNLYNIYKELRQLNLLTKDGINPKFKYGYLQFSEIAFKFKEVV